MINKMTPAHSAAFTFRLTGGKPNPEAVAIRFLADAAEWEASAEKALASKTGTFRGFTAAQHREVAADLASRAVTVPAELRKLMGAA